MTPDRLIADRVYFGGRVYTMRSEDEFFEGLAIRDGNIIALGSKAELDGFINDDTVVEDLHGRTTVPGFIDAHVHLEPEFAWRYGLPDAASFQVKSGQALRDAVLATIIGAPRVSVDGWDRASVSLPHEIPDESLPDRYQLDSVSQGRALVVSVAPRVFLVNSVALDRSGLLDDAAPREVPEGVVGTDSDGVPTGLLRGRALELLLARSPFRSDSEIRRYLQAGADQMLRNGVTTIHQITRNVGAVRGWQAMARESTLPLRVGLLIRGYHSETSLTSILNVGFQHGFGSRWLSFQGVKISIDGTIPERGAAMVVDYEDAPGWHGRLRVAQDALDEFIVAAHLAGTRCAVHCKGDRAIEMALRSFERAFKARPDLDIRHRLEHAGNLHCPAPMIQRMKAIGLCAVPNPPFMTLDAGILEARLGHERAAAPVNVRDFLDAGVPVITASDFNTGAGASFSPLDGIASLVTRQVPDGRAYGKGQAISVWEAMRCYTTKAAWLGFEESWKGQLAPGFVADLSVLSDDPFRCSPDRLREIEVLDVVVGGQSR